MIKKEKEYTIFLLTPIHEYIFEQLKEKKIFLKILLVTNDSFKWEKRQKKFLFYSWNEKNLKDLFNEYTIFKFKSTLDHKFVFFESNISNNFFKELTEKSLNVILKDCTIQAEPISDPKIFFKRRYNFKYRKNLDHPSIPLFNLLDNKIEELTLDYCQYNDNDQEKFKNFIKKYNSIYYSQYIRFKYCLLSNANFLKTLQSIFFTFFSLTHLNFFIDNYQKTSGF